MGRLEEIDMTRLDLIQESQSTVGVRLLVQIRQHPLYDDACICDEPQGLPARRACAIS